MHVEASAIGAGNQATEYATGLVDLLAGRIGPRRPCSQAERAAAELIAKELTEAGLDAGLESFRGPTTFAWAAGFAPALAVLGLRKLAVLFAALESDLRAEPVSRLVSRGNSQNVVARIDPAGSPQRTLVLVSHLDSSRSGLLFHPAAAPHLRKLLALTSAAMVAQGLAPVLPTRLRRASGVAAKGVLAAGLALLAERELRGRDVPGANDNASGVAVATAVARELAERPLESTRVVFLATGCEESGTAGVRSFLEAHRGEWEDWLFVNLDGVGAPATLRYLPREGIGRIYRADPALVRVCAAVARARPELGLQPATRLVGLTYDATPVMARKGRAITLSAQDETIPNYHTADDVPEALDPVVLKSAIEAVRLVAAAIDRGEADA